MEINLKERLTKMTYPVARQMGLLSRSNRTKGAETKDRRRIKLISSTFGIWNFNQMRGLNACLI